MDPVVVVCAVIFVGLPVAFTSHLSAAIAGGSVSSSLILVSFGTPPASLVLRCLSGVVAFCLVAGHALSSVIVCFTLFVGLGYIWSTRLPDVY